MERLGRRARRRPSAMMSEDARELRAHVRRGREIASMLRGSLLEMRAVVVHEQGGPEVMRFEERDTPEPKQGEARVRLEASGVNYFDIRQRSGDFKVALPIILGTEGAGVVEAVGPNTDAVRVGE